MGIGVTFMRYGKIRLEILQNDNLTLNEKAIYIVLACFKDQNGTAYPSLIRLSNILNLNTSSISKGLHKLQGEGVISIKQNFNQNNQYTFCKYANFKVPYDIIQNQSLSNAAKVFYVVFLYLRRANLKQISNFLNISRQTATKYLGELVDRNLIQQSDGNYDKKYWLPSAEVVTGTSQYEGYAKIPYVLLDDTRLYRISKALYIILSSKMMNNSDNTAVVTHIKLKQLLHCGHQTLQQGIQQLTLYGYIKQVPCYKGYVYTLYKREKSHKQLFKEILFHPRTNYEDITYYAYHSLDKYLSKEYRFDKFRKLGYIENHRFVNLRSRYINTPGHRLNVQKLLNAFKILYLAGQHIEIAKQICSAIAYDYQCGGLLYAAYCQGNPVDLQKLCEICHYHYEWSITKTMYILLYNDNIPYVQTKRKKKTHLTRRELFSQRIEKGDLGLQEGSTMVVLKAISDSLYLCKNLCTQQEVQVTSVIYQLEPGITYDIQQECRYEPKIKQIRHVLVYAQKH